MHKVGYKHMKLRPIPKVLYMTLVDAVMDQPNPTESVRHALQECLTWSQHPQRDKTLAVVPGRKKAKKG